MDGRNLPSASVSSDTKVEKKSSHVLRDTIIAIVTRGLTWPLEQVTYQASQWTVKTSYRDLYRSAFQPSALFDSFKIFLNAGVIQTTGKAFTSLGTLRYVSEEYPDASATEKTLFATCLGAPLEAVLTSRGECRKVRQFLELQTGCKLPDLQASEYGRVLTANVIRVAYTALTTYGAIYKVRELLPTENPVCKAAIMGATTAAVQVVNMPIINFHTQVMQNINKPVRDTFRLFAQRTAPEMWKGISARAVHRAVYYTAAFGVTDVCDSFNQEKLWRNSTGRPRLFEPKKPVQLSPAQEREEAEMVAEHKLILMSAMR
jgi:hypothetical protein